MGGLISKLSRLSLNDVSSEAESKINNFVYPEEQNLNTPKDKFIADQILDPRSATVGIRRTPLVLVKVGDTPVRHKGYLETDLDECSKTDDSLSFELEESDVEEKSINRESISDVSKRFEISIENVKIEEDSPQEANNLGIHEGLVDTPLTEKGKKTFIYEDKVLTPESTPIKLKGGRTPLGVVSTNNSALPSPLGKPWRGIREERLRLGLENTPPAHEPFPDVVQSAPGKVGVKRNLKKSWEKARWAFDESIVI